MPTGRFRPVCGRERRRNPRRLALYDEIDQPSLGDRDLLGGSRLHAERLTHPAFELDRVPGHLRGTGGLALRGCRTALEGGDPRGRILDRCDRVVDSPQGDADLIEMCYMSADFKEGVDAFLNKRKPQWTGR